MNSWYTRLPQPGPLLLSGRRALESFQSLPSKPLLQRKNSLACGGSVASVLRTILLISSAMSTSTATTPSWNSGDCRPCRARLTSAPASWTSRAATSSLTFPTTSCVCGSTVRLADRARSRDGEGLGILTQDFLIFSGICCIPEVSASSLSSFLSSPLLKLSYPHQLIWERTKKPPSGHLGVGVLHPSSVLTPSCSWHRTPSTIPSGSTGTWRRTACVVNTK